MNNPLFRGPVAGKQNRLVWITGAGSGIGRATALRFALRGDTVLVTDINEPSAKETVQQITEAGGSAYAYAQDVTDADAWEQLLASIAAEHTVPDILVNNAGIAVIGSFLEQSTKDWARQMAVNVDGVYFGSRIVGEAMARHGEGGHIVNIASAGAWTPNRVAATYCVSKAAVLMLSESMRIDLSHSNIGVSAICPGVIRTNLMANSTRAGVQADTAEDFRTAAADAQARMSYAGAGAVARAIERAVTYDLGVVPVNPEAYFIFGARRVAPALTRYLLGLGSMGLTDQAALALSKYVPSGFNLRRKAG